MGYLSRNSCVTDVRAQTIQTRLEKGDCVDDQLNGFRVWTNIPDHCKVTVHLEAGRFNLTKHLIFEIDDQKHTYISRRGVLLPSLSHLPSRSRD